MEIDSSGSDNNLNAEITSCIDKAKLDFNKYCVNNTGKMDYTEFEKFIEDFLNDQPEHVRNKFPRRKFFEEYAVTQKDLMEKQEFEQAWEELNIRRLETKDEF
jgi:hypothetical protein